MTKQNPMNVRVGDNVTIDFKLSPHGPFTATVVGISHEHHTDIIDYIRDDGKKLDEGSTEETNRLNPDGSQSGAVDFVTEVRHGPYVVQKHQTSSYANNYTYDPGVRAVPGNPHIYGLAHVVHLVMQVVFNRKVHMPYGLIHEDKIVALWNHAQCPGARSRLFHTRLSRRNGNFVAATSYNRKHFDRWVLNNINRLVRSKKQWVADERARRKEEEREYFEDFDRYGR